MQTTSTDNSLPLSGVRRHRVHHMVMGPTCGMILADLGAEVIKIEPPGGDKTRKLPASASASSARSTATRRASSSTSSRPRARHALELIGSCDVMLENFRPG
jgi:formyl-CoA transferase